MRQHDLAAALAAALLFGAAQAAAADSYTLEIVVPGSSFHGVHGLTFDKADHLFAGSVVGESVYAVDTENGAVTTHVPAPEGQADDLEFGPDGTLVWTSFLQGKIRALGPDGQIRVLAEGLPGINSTAFAPDGRLFATQVFLGDALYEIDRTGETPARKIMEGMGGLNGFDFGPDGKLYGPLWFKGQVVRVDVDEATLEVVADGFQTPAAANFDSQGKLYVVDTKAGEVVRVDTVSGAKTVVAKVATSIDNLAIDSRDRLYISNMANNGIYEIDTVSGKARTVVEGRLAMPGDIALVKQGDREVLYVADLFAYRKVDLSDGKVSDIARMHGDTLEYPFSVSASGDKVLLGSWFTGTVQEFDGNSGKSLAMMHKFAAPHDALLQDDGSLVVAELGTGSLLRVSGDHGDTRTVIAKDLVGPVGLVQADAGSVYVTEAYAGLVTKVSLADGARTVVAKDLKLPEGIALAPDGAIVVAEVGLRRIVRIDPASGALTVIGENLPIGLAATEGTPPSGVPTGVAVGANGDVYFASDIENAIYRLKKSM